MNPRLRAFLTAAVLGLSSAGCNLILGNDPHDWDGAAGAQPSSPDDDATTETPGQADAGDGGREAALGDATATDATPAAADGRADAVTDGMADATVDGMADAHEGGAAGEAGEGGDGGCGSLSDPHTCGSCTNDCSQLLNVSSTGLTCNGGRCGYGCTAGYADCADAGNGCGTILSTINNCGGCGVACGSDKPLCAQADGGPYGCASGCSAGETVCSGTCATLATDPNHCGACDKACASAQICSGGTCQCPTSAKPNLCGASCTNTQTDNANCGSCGHACTGGQTCQAGACACPSGQTLCGTTCVDASTDSMHCGASCTACSGGATCQAGSCQCPTGTTLCAGSCVDLMGTDVANCGACGNSCAKLPNVSTTGLACSGGHCSYQCASGFADCGSTGAGCTTSLTTTSNCGACNAACSGGTPVCQAMTGAPNACASGCTAGQTNCSGTCTTLSNDSSHCGTCTTVCATGQSCVSSMCTCPAADPMLCNGACVNPQADDANCGACGHACPAAEICQSGNCVCPISANPNFCSGACTNTASDNSNCGMCGMVCPAAQTCQNSNCACPTSANPDYGGTACTNIQSDSANCGACTRACPSAETCQGGNCACPTTAKPDYCGTACTNKMSDSSNCGMCGHACSAGQTCQGGNCVCNAISCPNGCCNGNTCVAFASQTGAACGAGAACAACSSGTGCDTTSGKCSAANVMFVTSTGFTSGNFGGLAGADAQCQTAAQGAGLSGTFIAYLSTSTAAAPSRVQNARGWVRPDGLPVADTPQQLAAGNLLYPVLLDEHGQRVASNLNEFAMTGTKFDGTINAGETCVDWTSGSNNDTGAGGDPLAGYSGWQAEPSLSCGSVGETWRLYCLQNSAKVSVALPTGQGRVAFMTASPWIPSGGLAAADARCQSEAQAASLSGTYLAFLSTSTASAASRFDLGGAAWYRTDGVKVFAQNTDLNTFTVAAPICVAANGTTHLGNYYGWNGSSTPATAGTLATTCMDWTSNATADAGTAPATVSIVGFTDTADGRRQWGLTTLGCDFTSSLMYCLQK